MIFHYNSSFCVNSAFQFDATPKPNRSHRNISPRFFRNLGSPYLRYENFEESIELTLHNTEPKVASKMTQTENHLGEEIMGDTKSESGMPSSSSTLANNDKSYGNSILDDSVSSSSSSVSKVRC